MICECCEDQAQRKKVKQFESFNEIEVKRSLESEKREDTLENQKVKQLGILSSHHSIGDDLNSREHDGIYSARLGSVPDDDLKRKGTNLSRKDSWTSNQNPPLRVDLS